MIQYLHEVSKWKYFYFEHQYNKVHAEFYLIPERNVLM